MLHLLGHRFALVLDDSHGKSSLIGFPIAATKFENVACCKYMYLVELVMSHYISDPHDPNNQGIFKLLLNCMFLGFS